MHGVCKLAVLVTSSGIIRFGVTPSSSHHDGKQCGESISEDDCKESRFTAFGKALNKTGRPIYLAASSAIGTPQWVRAACCMLYAVSLVLHLHLHAVCCMLRAACVVLYPLYCILRAACCVLYAASVIARPHNGRLYCGRSEQRSPTVHLPAQMQCAQERAHTRVCVCERGRESERERERRGTGRCYSQCMLSCGVLMTS